MSATQQQRQRSHPDYETVERAWIQQPDEPGRTYKHVDRVEVRQDGEAVREIAVLVRGYTREVETDENGVQLKLDRQASASLGSLKYMDDVVSATRGVIGAGEQVDLEDFDDDEHVEFATATMLDPDVEELEENPRSDTFKRMVGYVSDGEQLTLAYERGTASLVTPQDIIGDDLDEPFVDREVEDQLFIGSLELAPTFVEAVQAVSSDD